MLSFTIYYLLTDLLHRLLRIDSSYDQYHEHKINKGITLLNVTCRQYQWMSKLQKQVRLRKLSSRI